MKILSFSFNNSNGGAAISAYCIYTLVRSANVDSKMIVARKFKKDPSIIGPRNIFFFTKYLIKQKICQILVYTAPSQKVCK